MNTPLPDSYDQALAELQQIVQQVQNEAVSLDSLTAILARASELILFCREKLRLTEEEIERLRNQLG